MNEEPSFNIDNSHSIEVTVPAGAMELLNRELFGEPVYYALNPTMHAVVRNNPIVKASLAAAAAQELPYECALELAVIALDAANQAMMRDELDRLRNAE